MLFDHLFLQFKNISEKYGWSIEIFNYCQVSGYQLKCCIVTSASEILSHGIEACIPCSAHTFQKKMRFILECNLLYCQNEVIVKIVKMG